MVPRNDRPDSPHRPIGGQGDDNHRSRAALLLRSAAFSLSKRRREKNESENHLGYGCVFIGLVLCSAAVAYYPMPIVRECPHCKAHVVHEETVSGNTIGAKFYTAGKQDAPMLPDHPWLAKCPMCGGLFWVVVAHEVEIGFDASKGKPQVKALSGK